VVVPGWCEPDQLLQVSLTSLRNQSVVREYPDMVELMFVGCEGVNLSIPSSLGFRVLCARRGKLRARHLGIEKSAGDIVVACDSDTYYPPNWLNLVLRPFSDPEVVAVSSPTWQGVAEPVVHFLSVAYYSGRMSGRASAFRRWAYRSAGGFNLAVDDVFLATGDTSVLVAEEEVGLMERLRRVGKVAFVDAPVLHLGIAEGRGLHAYR
jgi:glycosyltransferase involved in cell wall biosynthesis